MQFEYDVFLSDDIISITKHDETFFDIILNDYWEWIKTNDLNHYCNDYYDASQSDRHGQEVGKYSIEEYFDLHYDTIRADLNKYLLQPKFNKYF